MAVMSVCALTSVERPGVSFATCDRASDVLAMTLRSERKENILMVDEESGDQVVEMEGLRFMPACWYLHVRHNQNKIKKTTSVTEGSSAHDKLDSILPSSELELRFSKLFNDVLDGLLVAGKVVLLTPQLARGVFGRILQGRCRVQRFFVPER